MASRDQPRPRRALARRRRAARRRTRRPPRAADAAPADRGPQRRRAHPGRGAADRRGPPAQQPAKKPKNGKPAKPPKPPRRGRRRSGGWIVLLVIVLVAALIGALGWWYGSARSVAVPSVVGKSLAAAQAAFAGSGLTLQAGEPAYSETVKKDLVITTDPEPGGEARTGSTVNATLSLGPERYPVPDVQGQAPGDARSMIADGGLAVAKSVQQKSTRPSSPAGSSAPTRRSVPGCARAPPSPSSSARARSRSPYRRSWAGPSRRPRPRSRAPASSSRRPWSCTTPGSRRVVSSR